MFNAHTHTRRRETHGSRLAIQSKSASNWMCVWREGGGGGERLISRTKNNLWWKMGVEFETDDYMHRIALSCLSFSVRVKCIRTFWYTVFYMRRNELLCKLLRSLVAWCESIEHSKLPHRRHFGLIIINIIIVFSLSFSLSPGSFFRLLVLGKIPLAFCRVQN